MADNDPELTPEKRLLQLIEGGRGDPGPSSGGTAIKKASLFEQLKEFFSPDGLKSLFIQAKENWLSMTRERKDFVNLKGLNQLAKIFTVGLGIYLLGNIIYEIRVVNTGFIESLQMPQREIADIQLSEAKVFSTNLLTQADKLDVFTPYTRREQEKEEAKESEMSLRLAGIIKDWKLAGISIYPKNPARTFCMVEDLQRNTTTFLKVGDIISGLRVDRINPDSVVFRFNEETIELR